MAKRPDEIATLIVNGQKFEFWTSISVEARMTDWFPRFQFECSEFTPMPVSWLSQQFRASIAIVGDRLARDRGNPIRDAAG